MHRHFVFIRFLCCVIFISGAITVLRSQDSQFSQFYANPLYLNPALTGAHSGTFRLMSSYRNQWASAIDNPFTTYSAAGDIRFTLRNKSGSYRTGNDILAFGLQFFSDRVSQFDFNLNQISFFGAFHKLLDAESNQYLSAGLQLGLAQRGINYEDLTFQDQFDGVNQYNLPTTESLPANVIAHSDVAIGLHYSSQPRPDQSFFLGFSYHHFNQPNISLFDLDLNTTVNYEPFTQNSKISIHGGMSLNRSDLLAIQPRAIFISQGSAATAVVGANLKYRMIDSDDVSFHLGGWIRASDNVSSFQPTDFIISAAFEKKGLLIGFSYDYFLRKLSSSALGNGTFEFSVSYIGEHQDENNICPEF